ncbi:hypothetical protein [Hoeflea prorocentri]|uniref:Uncharacterized protein n=1 Tax=Hoeflea prorocentri TaxID=1922333 RepID=A0A9X3ZHA7_9HYPH|nr:hypothetical protein [Hoeflea prorocentri]MCY6381119.1 hypothetical protein [Hoeflea prorocentri]MDA5398919.1 hypothetical protein [Hoeflea prorocentri]
MKRKRLPLPKRFSAALTDDAYGRLRRLNDQWALGNNYLLVVLLENLDRFADPQKLDAVFREFIDEYGAPSAPKAGD